jgi:hypothetical protein
MEGRLRDFERCVQHIASNRVSLMNSRMCLRHDKEFKLMVTHFHRVEEICVQLGIELVPADENGTPSVS